MFSATKFLVLFSKTKFTLHVSASYEMWRRNRRKKTSKVSTITLNALPSFEVYGQFKIISLQIIEFFLISSNVELKKSALNLKQLKVTWISQKIWYTRKSNYYQPMSSVKCYTIHTKHFLLQSLGNELFWMMCSSYRFTLYIYE